MKKILLTVFFIFYSLSAIAATTPPFPVDKASAQWATALSSNDPQKVTALYDDKAFLYATFANKINTRDGLIDYFKKIMQHPNLKVQFDQQNLRVYNNETAINSGLYTFSYTDGNKTVSVPARYTFVYSLEPQGWLIVDHHSSILPDQ